MFATARTTWMAAAVALAASALLTTTALGALVLDDFTYTPDNTGLVPKSGGSGWDGSWGGSGNTSRVLIDADANLTYAGGGYDVPQIGSGRSYGDFNGFRGVNRNIDTNLVGTVWFSALVENVNDGGHAGIQFNNPRNSNLDYIRGNFDAGLNGSDQLEVRWGGSNFTSSSTYTLGDTHLILGRILVGAGNDSMDVWVDPANLATLGTPVLSLSGADMGADVFRAGVFSYGSSNTVRVPNGYVDALRMSDGDGNNAQALYQVSGFIPEPSTFLVWSLLVGLGIGLRWRRK